MSLSPVRPIEYTSVNRPIPMLRLFDAFESRVVNGDYNIGVWIRRGLSDSDSDTVSASNACGEYDRLHTTHVGRENEASKDIPCATNCRIVSNCDK